MKEGYENPIEDENEQPGKFGDEGYDPANISEQLEKDLRKIEEGLAKSPEEIKALRDSINEALDAEDKAA